MTEQNQSGMNRDHSYAMILACAPLVSLFFGSLVTNVVFPLIVWLLWRRGNILTDTVGRNVLNGQISWMIYLGIAELSMYVLIGFILFPLVGILWLILTIYHAYKVSSGDYEYEMPFSFRFLRPIILD